MYKLLCFLFVVVLMIGSVCIHKKRNFMISHYTNYTSNIIPRTVMITTPNKDTVPKYIWEQYDKYASGYKINVYDDEDCKRFLLQYFAPNVEQKFKALKKGAHKADLFRYAYLYIRGGIYMDVKTILHSPLDSIFNHDLNRCYLVKSIVNNSIYNGIIATPPKNPYIRQLLDRMIERTDFKDYLINTKEAYSILQKQLTESNKIKTGFNKTSVKDTPVFEVFEEKNSSIDICKETLDRHKKCVAIYDVKGNILFLSRDPNYHKVWK